MAIPLVVWGALAGLGTFGGILFWGKERAKLKSGDTAFVPVGSLNAVGTPVKIDSLAGLGGLVKVENITRAPHVQNAVDTASGTAGKEVGIAVTLQFPVTAVQTIERSGQQFVNPEKT